MKHFWTTLVLYITSICAYSDMTGLWILDWQSLSGVICAPDLFTISQDDQGNFSGVFNYTDATLSDGWCRAGTGNYSSNLTYNATTNFWMDNATIQFTYDNTTDTIWYLDQTDQVQLLYDRNGSYIPQSISMPFIGGVWINITVSNLTNQSYTCIPSSIIITQNEDPILNSIYALPVYNSSSNCSQRGYTLGFIEVPSLQTLIWNGPGTVYYTSIDYIFDPYNSPNQLIMNITNSTTGEPICVLSAQKFTDFFPLNGTWLLDWQSGFTALAPSVYQATPADNNAYITTRLKYLGYASGYLIGGPNNQYYDSETGIGFTYDQTTNTLLSFPTVFNDELVLYSPNGSLINNNFVASYWGPPLLANGSNVSQSCCVPNIIYLTPYDETLFATYIFDVHYDSNPACQNISQYITENPLGITLRVNIPSIEKLLFADSYNTTISFANASTTSEITVQTFLGQSQCTFNMAITSAPPPTPSKPSKPLSATWMSANIIYLVIGLVMMLI